MATLAMAADNLVARIGKGRDFMFTFITFKVKHQNDNLAL